EIINDSILVFNYKVALARYSNDHEILMEIVHTFLEECPEGLEAIKEGITTNDNSVIAKAAHAIKGSASYVNADRLREIACTFETIAKSGDLTNSEVMIDTMIKEFLLFKKTIKMLHSEDVKN
ncbi:Hpt domain-containing protein, partial [bacterium]|nr:Hpt domain-containing protein [bacterium]